MTSIRDKAGGLWHQFSALLRTRRESAPIDSVAKLQDFIATRSAYVAQKTLYGYVKTRMATHYLAMFEDDKIIASLNIAKMQVFAACLSDLTIFAVGIGLNGQTAGNDLQRELARRCYAAALHQNSGDAPGQFSAQECIDAFERRIAETDWRSGAVQPENFVRSPQALLRWAPIADNLKKFDAEIIENSVKFAWRDIREQLRTRINAAAIYADSSGPAMD